MIPAELGKLANLRELHLSDNELYGAIPDELGDLISLRRLSLQQNDLSGTLPQSLARLENLFELSFEGNSGLCAPDDAAFQEWLSSLSELSSSGDC